MFAGDTAQTISKGLQKKLAKEALYTSFLKPCIKSLYTSLVLIVSPTVWVAKVIVGLGLA